MKERISEFLRKENKTSAQFAEEIGVQPSGISHILSGRNKPSLDFVTKMLEKYPFLSTDWLLFGKGSMYKEPKMGNLFEDIDLIGHEKPKEIGKKLKIPQEISTKDELKVEKIDLDDTENKYLKVKKIIWFFENKEFIEFSPRKE